MAVTRRLAAIMFTDIAGYTALTQKDEKAALRLLRESEDLARPVLEAHRGRRVKSTGDGLLIEFPDALDAVECGVELQRHIHERNARPGAPPLLLRVGIHLGDVQGVGADIFGDAVNIASRIQPLAEPGGVCLSEPVYVQVRNKVAYRLENLGSKNLKGVQEPVGVYRVVFQAARVASASTPEGAGPPRLAVLPLINISRDPENEYFADGMTEELISALSQVKGLRVISRTSVSQYKNVNKPVAQIGAELGTGSVLEGSVRKAGDRLRITVQLIDTKTDEHRWSQTYDRKLEDVFAIQAEVAEQTATALKVELLKSERDVLQERPTASFAAYEAYLRGIQASRKSFSPRSSERDRQAVSYFERAIAEDPRFAAAYARLAHHLIMAGGETRPWTEVRTQARDLVAKALELDPNSSEAHMAQGNLAFQVECDWEHAELEFRLAIELNPSNTDARSWYALLLFLLQRFDEAEVQCRATIEQDPLNVVHRLGLVGVYTGAGNLGSAETLLKQLVQNFPESALPRIALAELYGWTGRILEGLRELELVPPSSDLRGWNHAAVMALLGKPGEARTFLAEWESGQLAKELSPIYLAALCAYMGDYERALTLVERAKQRGETLVNYQDYEFDPLRDDSRFVALLKSMDLPTTLSRPRRARPTIPS